MIAAVLPAILAVQTTEPTAVTIPESFRDYAFEYKLGWDDGPNAGATCPIKRSHMLADQRRAAWKAGYLAHRTALGLKAHSLRPLNIRPFGAK